jgi:hypothetical protein
MKSSGSSSYCDILHKIKMIYLTHIFKRVYIRCSNLTSLFALFVFLLCRLTSGAFTIDSLTLTLMRNLNEHSIL